MFVNLAPIDYDEFKEEAKYSEQSRIMIENDLKSLQILSRSRRASSFSDE